MTPPPLNNDKPHNEGDPIPVAIASFRVMGVNTIRLLKRIEEEGEEVWLDER